MSKRKWNSGKPPHVGWWLTETGWRWWDGISFSSAVPEWKTSDHAGWIARGMDAWPFPHRWCDYWPANARVPRINPNKKG